MEQAKPCEWKLGQEPETLAVAASFPGRGICEETAKKKKKPLQKLESTSGNVQKYKFG